MLDTALLYYRCTSGLQIYIFFLCISCARVWRKRPIENDFSRRCQYIYIYIYIHVYTVYLNVLSLYRFFFFFSVCPEVRDRFRRCAGEYRFIIELYTRTRPVVITTTTRYLFSVSLSLYYPPIPATFVF